MSIPIAQTNLADLLAAVPALVPKQSLIPETADDRVPSPPPRRCVVIEGDDLGLLYAFNEGIRVAFQDGVLTSTCLRANGYAYEHAVQEILPACRGMGVGVHLCLNEAEPVAPRESVPALLNRAGQLRGGFFWLMRRARTTVGLEQIERELRAQIERVRRDGVPIDHLNSHQHVHMIPAIFRLTCRLAREYGIPCIRLTREAGYGAGGIRKHLQPWVNTNLPKRLLLNTFASINEAAARTYDLVITDYFLGVNYTAHMSRSAVLAGLESTPYGCVEMLLHPAIGPDPRDVRYPSNSLARYIAAPQRRRELKSLCSSALAEFLKSGGWSTMTYSSLADETRRHQPRVSTPEIPAAVREFCDTVPLHCPPWVSEAQDDSRAFAQVVISQTRSGLRVLDVGTGTGNIAIALAKFGCDVTASDISKLALRTAAANARRQGIVLRTVRSDLLASIDGRFDLIAFNPPYNFRPDNFAMNIAKHLVRRMRFVQRNSGLAMPRAVLRFHQKLIERLMQQAPNHLNAGGALLLHAFETEVAALAKVMPADATYELLNLPRSNTRTVGMLIRLAQHARAQLIDARSSQATP